MTNIAAVEGLWGVGKTTTRKLAEKQGYVSIPEPDHAQHPDQLDSEDRLNFLWYTRAFAQKLEQVSGQKTPVLFERSYASTLAFFEAMTGEDPNLDEAVRLGLWNGYQEMLATCILLTFEMDGYLRRLDTLPDQEMANFLLENTDFLVHYPDALRKYAHLLFGSDRVIEVPVGTSEGFIRRAEINHSIDNILTGK